MFKNLLLSLLISCSLGFILCEALSKEARSKGFVYLKQIDPSIITSLRYCTYENFIGRPIHGYRRPNALLTLQAAQALKKAQEEFKKDGYCLVVYDAYRPQQAVNHFMRWSKDIKDQAKKAQYFPHVDKSHVFELGYVAEHSGHSRGSTVDVTLITKGAVPHKVIETKRTLQNGQTIKFLDDGTVDMGSSFDLFDKASHHKNNLIAEHHKKSRTYLRTVMEKHGFKTIEEEWWHYTLKDEPYPAKEASSYFNFPVE